MKKISYSLVFNRKKKLNKKGMALVQVWGIERSVFFNGREKWTKGFENQRV